MVRGRKNPCYVSLPARLRKARRAAGLPLRALSVLAGLSHDTVRNIETAGSVPSIETVEKLANTLKVAPQWLAFAEETTVAVSESMRYDGLASRLAEARKQSDLSLRTLGDKAGLPAGTVHAVERSKYVPSITAVEKLAKALGISPGWLAYGNGPDRLFEGRTSEDRLTIDSE